MVKWQSLSAWHRSPGHGFGQKSLPRSLVKKADWKDFSLSGFVLWPAPHLSPTAHVPHCSVPQCCSGSLQASPMWETELWPHVQADAAVSPAGCSPAGCSPAAAAGPAAHGQRHSTVMQDLKGRREEESGPGKNRGYLSI